MFLKIKMRFILLENMSLSAIFTYLSYKNKWEKERKHKEKYGGGGNLDLGA